MKKIFNNIFFIGLLSFFGGISQDIFVPILPIYLMEVLGLSKSFIGISEGLVKSSASIFKIASGFLSDKFHKNKHLVFLGYFLSFVSRPLLAFFNSGVAVMSLRVIDGVGKGMKDSPKDVLISASTKAESRGRGFGIVRMLDTLGSVVGPLILFVLLYIFQSSDLKYHYILLFCSVPLLITLLILIFKVKEVDRSSSVETQNLASLQNKQKLPARFYWFLIIVAIFSLGNFSDAFLILRAKDIGVTLLAIPLVYALFNAFYAFASVPLGSLSDKIGREKVILLGWASYALAYLGFAFADQTYQVWILFAFYGIYFATTEGVAKALVADIVPTEYRGRAYGIYNSVIGVIALPSSFIAGYLWDTINPQAPFFFGAGIALLSAVLLVLFLSSSRRG